MNKMIKMKREKWNGKNMKKWKEKMEMNKNDKTMKREHGNEQTW